MRVTTDKRATGGLSCRSLHLFIYLLEQAIGSPFPLKVAAIRAVRMGSASVIAALGRLQHVQDE